MGKFRYDSMDAAKKCETPFQSWCIIRLMCELEVTFSGIGRPAMNRIQTTFKFHRRSSVS